MISIWKKWTSVLWGMILICVWSCSDKKEDFSDIPGIEKYSWSPTVSFSPDGETVQVSFTALEEWSAWEEADWCTLSSNSGSKGQSSLSITVEKNQMGVSRTTEVVFYVKGYKSVSFVLKQEKQEKSPLGNENTEMNVAIDKYLQTHYLWNDEYMSMTRDLTIPYVDAYENYLKQTLLQMTTNTLDKKRYVYSYTDDGEPIYDYKLYSFVDRVSKAKSRNVSYAGVNHDIEKDAPTNSYGFSMINLVNLTDETGKPSGKYAYVVSSVYPNSPATIMGVKRGDIIYKVNDKQIDQTNYVNYYLELLQPTQNSVKIMVGKGSDDPEEKTLVALPTDKTPILMSKVLEESGHKIGYLCYESFNAAYDDDLLEAIIDLKSQGITDLVLDLRYNGGGYVISSMMLSSCIAGDKCDKQKFIYTRYNKSRMADVEKTERETGEMYDEEAGYFYTEYSYPIYYGVDLSSYSLDLNHLYVLTTGSTASSSELLISSLRGIDVPVTVIGEATNGKNVGMEIKRFDAGNYSYELVPITFQYYNAKLETIPEDGMSVDYPVNDWNNGFVDFGEKEEPMLAKALELITGVKAVAQSRNVSQYMLKLESVYIPSLEKRLKGALVIRSDE